MPDQVEVIKGKLQTFVSELIELGVDFEKESLEFNGHGIIYTAKGGKETIICGVKESSVDGK